MDDIAFPERCLLFTVYLGMHFQIPPLQVSSTWLSNFKKADSRGQLKLPCVSL